MNGEYKGNSYANLKSIVLRFVFTGGAIDKNTVGTSVSISNFAGTSVPLTFSYDNDTTLIVSPNASLTPMTGYRFAITTGLKSVQNAALQDPVAINLYTAIDSTDKFPQISDSVLLTMIEQQTLKYFYEFGHPVSGLARERNTSADVVTTGGSGFGIMALIVGAQRNFITHAQALSRIRHNR